MRTLGLLSLGLITLTAPACGGGGDRMPPGGPDAGGDPSSPSRFRVTIENRSDRGPIATPLSPVFWAAHAEDRSLFEEGAADRGDGLEAIAEEGDPSALADSLAALRRGAASGPILPGETAEIEIEATAEEGRLSLASMFGQSNDYFFAPSPEGVPLFDDAGMPLGERDVTGSILLWDLGTEANEPLGAGPNQAPRQESAGEGRMEGIVGLSTHATRSLPAASRIASIRVSEDGGVFTVSMENVSAESGAVLTPLAPVFYALHDQSWTLFREGEPDPGDGLESLAEDGSPQALVASQSGAAGVGEAGAQAVVEGGDGEGPAFPGDRYVIEVTPTASHPRLSIATMVGQSNDAFLAFGEGGVALLDESGAPRPAAEVEEDIRRALAVWDAGTEANQVIGSGPHQAPRQSAPGEGPADEVSSVRRYADATNDLAGENAGGFAELVIEHGEDPMSFDVTLTNRSGETAFPGVLTPAFWMLHDGSGEPLFSPGEAADAALERLAEDGDASPLMAAAEGDARVGDAGVAGSAPLMPGESVTVTITADGDAPLFTLASMIVPSNDTFLSPGPAGVELLDEQGRRRSEAEIAADVAALLRAWDAGTEANQAGAAGPDQAPRQSAPNTGAPEGSGLVRVAEDPVWGAPAVEDLIRVTITPL